MTQGNLSFALVQADLFWEDKFANFAHLEELIWKLDEKVDVIILPEMFSTGFSMNAETLSEPMNLHATKWMKQIAAQTKSVVTGSVIIKSDQKFFNRLLWVDPEGKIDYYDKRHLFRMAKEDNIYSEGTERKVFELKGWKIMPQVCYDLRFPVFSRNSWNGDQAEYDLLFYVASWPAARSSAWEQLLPARAIENLSYSIGVNRIGIDGNEVSYKGQSAAYDFKGNKALSLGEKEKISVVSFSYSELSKYRQKFPAWMDSDPFALR